MQDDNEGDDMISSMKAFARTKADSMHVEMITMPLPVLSEDEVLVAIEAFGVGIHDRYFIPEDVQFPYVIGIEGAGQITALGENVVNFAVGDRVAFTSSMNPKGGTWAQYAAVKQAALIHVPDGLSTLQAASVPVAGGTAQQGLSDLNLAIGETLFIAGASGAIGSFAIQLAAQQGVRVAGSASAENQQYMRSLGTEKTVDYSAPDWQAEVWDWAGEGVDAALAIQPNTGNDAIKVTRDGGRVITISGYGDTFAVERGISAAQMTHMHDSRQRIEQLLSAITEGSIQTMIEAEYSFSQALAALEKTETRHARGKLVVNMRD